MKAIPYPEGGNGGNAMRRVFAIILLLTVFLLSACNSNDVPPNSSAGTELQQTEISATTTDNETMMPENVTEAAKNSSSQLVTENSESTESSTEETVKMTEEPTSSPPKETVTFTEPETVPVTETKKQTATETQEKPVEKTETEKTEEVIETKPEATEPEQTTVVRADPYEVEMLVAQYVNQQRNAEGAASMTVLSGLTQVARYRSEQIVQNFAHANSATICTELKYGEFVDMTQYGMSESDSYYQGYNREALAKGNWGGTAEEVAQKIAVGFKNSSSHWKYLSSAEYSYMAVGCTYDEGTNMWYCCICVSAKNYGG